MEIRWRNFWMIWAMLLVAALVWAQTPKPPVIPPDLITRTFKAQAEVAQAQLGAEHAQNSLQQKNEEMKKVYAELQAACGEKFQPQLDQSGNPVCALKAVPKAEMEKK